MLDGFKMKISNNMTEQYYKIQFCKEKEKKSKWHEWFAWYPVKITSEDGNTYDLVWLQTIERTGWYMEPDEYLLGRFVYNYRYKK